MNNDSQRMCDKIFLNSYYPTKSSDCFYMYDANLAAKITKAAQETLNKMEKTAKFEKRKRIISKLMDKNLYN